MGEARSRERWARTSAVMGLVANCHRDPKKSRPFKPSDFDPCAAKKGEAVVLDKESIGLLKQAFTEQKGVVT